MQSAKFHLYPHWLLSPTLLPPSQPVLCSPCPCHQTPLWRHSGLSPRKQHTEQCCKRQKAKGSEYLEKADCFHVFVCLFNYLFIFSGQAIITFKNCIMHSDRVLSWQNEHSAFLNPVLLKKLLNHLALWKECDVCCLGRMLVAVQPLESSPFFSCSFLSVKKNHSWNSCKILHNISFRSELSDRFQELHSLVFHVMLSLVKNL